MGVSGRMTEWWLILKVTWRRMGEHNVSALAGGSAFQALLSLFPILTAVVSVYGLVADRRMVAGQIAAIDRVLPREAAQLIATWLHSIVHGPVTKFGIGLIVSLLLGLWTLWSATAMLMTSINICYGARETRGFAAFSLRAAALSAAFALFAIVALVLVALLPAALALLPMPAAWAEVLGLARWPMLAGLMILALAVVYRYAPDRAWPKVQWISWGAAAATGLWIVGSAGFTIYVSTVGSYDRTYGSLGAVIVLLLWFYLTAYVILAGAELNAAVEDHAAPARHVM